MDWPLFYCLNSDFLFRNLLMFNCINFYLWASHRVWDKKYFWPWSAVNLRLGCLKLNWQDNCNNRCLIVPDEANLKRCTAIINHLLYCLSRCGLTGLLSINGAGHHEWLIQSPASIYHQNSKLPGLGYDKLFSHVR